MSKIIGWCHNHETPLPKWRRGHPQTVAVWDGTGCRVCSIANVEGRWAYDVRFWQRPEPMPYDEEGSEGPAIFDSDAFDQEQARRLAWEDRRDEANAPDPAVTSTALAEDDRVWLIPHREAHVAADRFDPDFDEGDVVWTYWARTLAHTMSEISEEEWFAEWLSSLEHHLWDVIHRADRPSWISEDQCQRLRDLSRRAGGWVVWDREAGRRFVTLEQWATIREANR